MADIRREKGDLRGFKVITGTKLNYQEWKSRQNEGIETFRSNPDLLPMKEPKGEGRNVRAMRQARLDLIPALTPQQLRVFNAIFESGHTIKQTATLMTLSYSRIYQLKQLVAKKLKEKFYEALESSD